MTGLSNSLKRPKDPRLRRLVLKGPELAERDAQLRATGLSPEALSQVQQWTPGWIRFGPVPRQFRAQRAGALVGGLVLMLLGTLFAWLEWNPGIKTNPPGDGYYAAAVFLLAGIALIIGRRWMVPGRYQAPRVLIDLERQTTSAPRRGERAWTSTRWVLFKWHSHAGMSDTGTSLEWPVNANWDLSGFDTQHPDENHHALSGHRHSLLEDMSLAALMEVCEKLIELGICRRIDIDPPQDGRDTSSELEGLLRPGFRLWKPRPLGS